MAAENAAGEAAKEQAPPKKQWGAPRISATDVFQKVAANDASVDVVDLSGSAIFQMRSEEYMAQLCDALKDNTIVREINLSNCGIGDKGCESLATFLASGNTYVAFINLEKNGISAAGASAIASGLKKNSSLREINLMNQTQGSRWTDRCLDDFLEMFETNVSLIKIVWRLESRKSFAINKMVTRNNEIERRIKSGMDYDDVLPTSLKGQKVTVHNQNYKPASEALRSAPAASKDGEGAVSSTAPRRINKVLARWPPAGVDGSAVPS